MDNILLSETDVLEYVSDTLSDIKYNGREVFNAKYHHNTDYKDASSICKYGILTLEDLNRQGIRNDSDEFLKIMSDTESHVNGKNAVSLCVVGLKDLYPNEDEYNPFSPNLVDFLVTSDIKVSRSSIHYGNEFLSFHSIKKEELKSIDIRLLKLIQTKKMYIDYYMILSVLQKYNYLRKIAIEMQKQSINIPLREMSEKGIFELDIDKLSTQPKLVLKK